jgi:1-acyl-sn-glycerol-3-phosphate acyltransferase
MEPEPFTRTYRLAMGVCRPLAGWGRLQVEGLEALPRGGPVVLAGNHDSRMDPVIIGLAAARRRQIRALAKSSLWDIRGLGPVLDGMGQIPIERAAGDADALARAIKALRAGACIGVFPEGTITCGRELRARSGIGRLAVEVPESRLVCVAIEGAPDYVRFPKRPSVKVRFFEPASGQTAADESPADVAERLLAELRAVAPRVPAGRKPAATLRKYELKAEAHDAKRRKRAAAAAGSADEAERDTAAR